MKIQRYILLGLFLVTLFIVYQFGLPVYCLPALYILYTAVFVFVNRQRLAAYRGTYNMTLGRAEKAKAIFVKCVLKNNRFPMVYLNYAVLLLKEGKAEDALELLHKGLSLNPHKIDEKNMLLTMGSCYWVLGQIDDAVVTLEALRAKNDYVNANVLTTLGYMYFLKDDPDKALEISLLAVADNAEHAPAYDNLGQINYKRGETDKAEENFIQAITLNDNMPDSYYYLSLIAMGKGNKTEAIAYAKSTLNCAFSALNSVSRVEAEGLYKKLTEKIED